jgi:hypothetical protein
MKWPKSAGKTIDDYLRAAAPKLDRRAFETAIREYLKNQNLPDKLDRKALKTLFEISRDFLRQCEGVAAIEKARVTLDWNKRKQLMKRLTKRFSSVREYLKPNPDKAEFPLAALLARSIRSKVDEVLLELDLVAELQRLEKFRFATLRKSSKRELDYVWEIDSFLRHQLPTLKAQERNLVIAGAMIAAGIRADEPEKDIVGTRPMARSRALRELRNVDMVVRWAKRRQLHERRKAGLGIPTPPKPQRSAVPRPVLKASTPTAIRRRTEVTPLPRSHFGPR